MNSLRLRMLFPLWLFGFLPAMGAAKLMDQPLDWFYGVTGVVLGGGVFLAAYLIGGWVLKPASSVMKGTTAVLRGVPPDTQSAEWLPSDFGKLRCDINMIFAKQRQALNAAEQHATQTAQRLLNAERLLREAFTALQGLFAASDEGVAVIDAQGSIIASNGRLDAFLGKPVEEIAGRDASRLVAAFAERFADGKAAAEWLQSVASNLDGQDQMTPMITADGEGVFSIRTVPMRTDAGEIVGRIWVVKDHSQLRVLEKQLRESQKLGTIGQLAGGIAHDFNNLLTTIRGNLTLAELTSPANPGAVRDRLQNATHATQRAADLVKSLLGYSRFSNGSSARKPVNLKRLMADVQQILKHSVDSKVNIQMRAGMDDSHVLADATQVQQVMLNLCLNARDALPSDNGVIEIAVENVTRAAKGPNGGDSSDFVMLVVRDNGHGISEENRHRIFEPFFTTKNASKGSGLGLATAQDIVREHGGWIEFDSEIGRGSEFRVYLPRTSQLEENEDQPQENLSSGNAVTAPLGTLTTILVVDDEAPVRSIAANMLNFLGYRVIEAADGQQMLDMCLRSGEKIDGILLDIYMPKLSGREAFKQLRAENCDIPVVVCSGFIIDPDEFMILSQGHPPPVDIMLKPYSLDGLSKALAKAIGAPAQDAATRSSFGVSQAQPVLVA
ncbi:MAG: response regulator [Verrucomicrobiaceae bacterium]|nr:response regulator [Verrucomicrobiaceae bacterium]